MVAPNSPIALAKPSTMPASTPGSASGSVTVKNTNDFQVSLRGLTKFTVTGDVDRDHRACKFADNFKATPPVLNPAITMIGARKSVQFDGGSITLTNDPNLNQIACQGATVTLSYVLK